ncbi:MAG: hydantoinase B/oxoprolinase family protein, partial [Bacteroidetes bacterium]|nr:hydantoinase B/oxoprolinase family protein [Bacteroidota bacterium]
RRAPVNSTYAMTFSGCAYGLRALLDKDLPVNDGFYRHMNVTAPPGTVTHAVHPAPVVGGWETEDRLNDLIFKALSEAVPERVPAGTKAMQCQMGFGVIDPVDREYKCSYEALAGGYGGRATLDGPDAVQAHGQNTENAPIEETEAKHPVRINRYELVENSDGPGKHRGGLGLRRDYMFPDVEARFTILADREISGPWGLFGGKAGKKAYYILNPDGEARNRAWIAQWPRLAAYLTHAIREPPGRDLEFGFPAMRVENRLVADFMRAHAPFTLHMSLHGMGFSEGAMLLIDRHWAGRTQRLRDGFSDAARAAGLRLHDHNRKGEKGFFYIEPGFTTTPEGAAMRAYFLALRDETTAACFHDSSMEFARSLGGDPLCLVTELPLFVLAQRAPHEAGRPAAYLAFRERLPQLRLQASQASDLSDLVEPFGLQPLDLRTAVGLHLRALTLGLEIVSEALPA